MTRRPYVQVRPYTWNAQDGTQTRGVALMQGIGIRAHMTPAEAKTKLRRQNEALMPSPFQPTEREEA